jgi:hypothetical protein
MTKKLYLRLLLLAVMLVAAVSLDTPARASCYCYDEYDECIQVCDAGDRWTRPECYNNCGYAFDLCFWTYCA